MSRNLDLLHPRVKEMALRLIADSAEAKIPILVTQTLRTIEEQDGLYAQGRTEPGPPCIHHGKRIPVGSCRIHPFGCRVTNARGGQSYHNYGLAFDVAVLDRGTLNWIEGVDVNDNDISDYEDLGTLGERIGLEWGGRWKFADMPHFQHTFGLTLNDLRTGKKPPKG